VVAVVKAVAAATAVAAAVTDRQPAFAR